MKIRSLLICALSIVGISSCGPNTIKHTVVFDSHGGSEVPSQSVVHGEKIDRPANPIKLGYDFLNWTYNGEDWSFDGFSCTKDMTLDANWGLTAYSITYDLDGGSNYPSNPSFYTIESDTITLGDAIKDNYLFIKWVNVDTGDQVTKIEKGSHVNLNLKAVYEGLPHTVTVLSEDYSKGNVTGGGTYKTGESVTVKATVNPGYCVEGWYDGPTRVSQNATYTFVCSKDITLMVKFNFVIGD